MPESSPSRRTASRASSASRSPRPPGFRALSCLSSWSASRRCCGRARSGACARRCMATNLAPGALVAWQVPVRKLDAAFDFMFQQDPFSGHVVIRSTDPATPGSNYRLWTTLKVPQGFSMGKHGEFLLRQTGAEHFGDAGEAVVRAWASGTCAVAAWPSAERRKCRPK